jgi:hypothetical protein
MTKLLLFIAILAIATTAQAKIWRVNNNPGLDGDVLQGGTLFDNTNNATNPEASAGDTIYIEPSPTTYTNFAINKANIRVFGYGYFLDNNPGMQAMANNAEVNYIELLTGSEGSEVSGLEFTFGFYIYTGNVTITRCNVATIDFYQNATSTTYSGIRIDKCFIRNSITSSNIVASVTSVSTTIENCIFSSPLSGNNTSGITINNKVRGLLRNNVFNSANSAQFYNFYVANNIFVGAANFGTVAQSGNNIYRNNLFSYPISQGQYAQVGGNTGANSGNLFSVNMALVFNGTPDNTTNGTTLFNNRIEFVLTQQWALAKAVPLQVVAHLRRPTAVHMAQPILTVTVVSLTYRV